MPLRFRANQIAIAGAIPVAVSPKHYPYSFDFNYCIGNTLSGLVIMMMMADDDDDER